MLFSTTGGLGETSPVAKVRHGLFIQLLSKACISRKSEQSAACTTALHSNRTDTASRQSTRCCMARCSARVHIANGDGKTTYRESDFSVPFAFIGQGEH